MPSWARRSIFGVFTSGLPVQPRSRQFRSSPIMRRKFGRGDTFAAHPPVGKALKLAQRATMKPSRVRKGVERSFMMKGVKGRRGASSALYSAGRSRVLERCDEVINDRGMFHVGGARI